MTDAQALALRDAVTPDDEYSGARRSRLQDPRLRGWRLDPNEQLQAQLRLFERRLYLRQRQALDEYIDLQVANDDSVSKADSDPGIPMHRLLKIGALILAISSVTSLAVWLLADVTMAHPAASLLVLCASPFIYLMGKAAERQLQRSHA